MDIFSENVVKIASLRAKDFYKVAFVIIGVLAMLRAIIFVLLTWGSSNVEFVADDTSGGWTITLFLFLVSIAVGAWFASETSKFIRRGITRSEYFAGTFLANTVNSLLLCFFIRILNVILTTFLSNLVISANPVNLEVGILSMIFIYLLNGMTGFLLGFLIAIGWQKLGLGWQVAAFLFAGWSLANAMGLFQNWFSGSGWISLFVLELSHGGSGAIFVAAILIPILLVVNYLVLKSFKVKV